MGTFYKNIGLLVLLNALIKPFGIFIESIAQNDIGHDFWGDYTSVNSLALILSFLLNPGFQQILSIETAKKNQPYLFFQLQHLQFLIFPLYLGFLFLCGWLLDYSSLQYYLIIICSITYLGYNYFSLLRSRIQGLQLYKLDAWFSNLDKSVFIIGTVICITIFEPISLTHFLSIKVIAITVTIAGLRFIIQKRNLFKTEKHQSTPLKELFTLSLPFGVIFLLNTFHERVDIIMIRQLTDSYNTSIYSAAYRIYDGFMMFLWVLGPYFLSRIAFHHKNKAQQRVLLQNGTSIIILPIIFVTIFITFYGRHLFFMFDDSPSDLWKMQSVLLYLCVPLVLNAICLLPVTYLIEKKIFRPIIISSGIAAITNIILNIYTIPKWGINGAAITTGISTSIISITYLIYNKKDFSLNFNYWKKIIVTSLVAFISFSIGQHLHWHWSIVSLFGMMSLIAMILLTKIIKY